MHDGRENVDRDTICFNAHFFFFGSKIPLLSFPQKPILISCKLSTGDMLLVEKFKI